MRFDFETGLSFGMALQRLRGLERRTDEIEESLSGLETRLTAIEAWGLRLGLVAVLAIAGVATNWAPEQIAEALRPLLKAVLKAVL